MSRPSIGRLSAALIALLALVTLVGLLLVRMGSAPAPLSNPPPGSTPVEAGYAEPAELIESNAPYLRAVHWFGDAWPVNFWNTDIESRARQDFQKIIDDGFNTVVFLVPWPGFAPDPHAGTLDNDRVERLVGLMTLADDLGLKTILRVSYAWDGMDDVSGQRLLSLWQDESFYRGWLDHLEALWVAVHELPGFQFGFFSWEDLWAATSLVEADEATRASAAQTTGFADWLLADIDPARREALFGRSFDNAGDVVLPQRREPAFELYMQFISQAWVNRFFLPAQERFPQLSMEIRIDSDPIFDGDELIGWFHHYDAWNLPGGEWVTLYWSPAMGGVNQGETLEAEEAARRLEGWLEQVARHAGPRQIFIGQFLAEDFTPGYELNGRLARERVGEFLELAQPILAAGTGGYGLWTWTDYGHDLIGNPEFFVGLDGWERSQSGVQLDGAEVLLSPDGWLSFSGHRWMYHAPGGPESARLCVRGRPIDNADEAVLRIYQGVSPDSQRHLLEQLVFSADGDGEQCIEHDAEALTFWLVAESAIRVERVNSIGFVQKSGMRETDFSLKAVAQDYRSLNAGLKFQPDLGRPLFEDGWMGRFWLQQVSIEGLERPVLELKTAQPSDWPVEVELAVAVDGQSLGSIACLPDGHHEFAINGQGREAIAILLESSQTHRPLPDQRDLGCRIDWSIRDMHTGEGAESARQ